MRRCSWPRLAGLLLAAGFSCASALAEDTVKVGLGLPLSGGAAFMGSRYLKGWTAGVADVNSKGGVNGRQLELVVRDQQSSAAEAVTVAKRLIELDHVSVIDVTQPGSATLATKSIALETQTPMISGITYFPGAVDSNNPYFFRVGGNNNIVAATAAKLIKQLGKKRVAVLAINEDYGRGMVDVIGKSAAEAGYEVVFADFYDRAQTDFSSILLKMRAAQPDLYFIDIRYPQSVTALKQMVELGIKGPKIGTAQLFNTELTARVGKALDDTYVVIGWATLVKGEASDAFQAAYRKSNADEPDDFAADGWTVAHIVADALRRAGPGATGSAVRDAIAATQIMTPKGATMFNSLGDSPMPMNVLHYSDGTWQIVPLE
jgi:branched-chain amino acid transport system substrate-binding protein